jgi:3-oxoadipate enol-lactonase
MSRPIPTLASLKSNTILGTTQVFQKDSKLIAEHLPARLTVPGVSSALRFQALDDKKWLGYYDLESLDVLKSKEYAVLKENASDNERGLIPKVNMDRRVYKLLSSTGKQAASPPKTLLAVEMTPYPSHEKEFHDWYDTSYMPHMAERPGWSRSRRFELIEPLDSDVCKFLTLHEFDMVNALGEQAHDRAKSVKWRNEVIEIVTDRARSIWEPYHAANEPPGTHIVNHDGIQFNVKVDGKEDGPVIAFSNPLGANLSVWDKVVAALAPTYRLIRHDQRGHGHTSQPTKNTTFPELADDLVAILDHLKAPKVHALIGVSMGGVVVLDFALRHPQRVNKVIYCDAQPASTTETKSAWDARIAFIKEKGVAALADQTADRWFTESWKKNSANHETFKRTRDMVAATPVQGFIANARAMDDYSYIEAAKGLKIPSLLVCGAEDPPLESMRELEKAIPGGKMVLIDDCGHLPMIEKPEDYIKVLKSFL